MAWLQVVLEMMGIATSSRTGDRDELLSSVVVAPQPVIVENAGNVQRIVGRVGQQRQHRDWSLRRGR